MLLLRYVRQVYRKMVAFCWPTKSMHFSHVVVSCQVLTSKGYDGTSSDVWSCGVILFVLMAGYLPFDEANLMALYKKVSIFRDFFYC